MNDVVRYFAVTSAALAIVGHVMNWWRIARAMLVSRQEFLSRFTIHARTRMNASANTANSIVWMSIIPSASAASVHFMNTLSVKSKQKKGWDMEIIRIMDLATIALVVAAYKKWATNGNPWGRWLWDEGWQFGDDGQMYFCKEEK